MTGNSLGRGLKLAIANFTVLMLRTGEEVLVGGQAVLEGVMMRVPRSYSIAVRKRDGSLVTKKERLTRRSPRSGIWRYPVLRGIITLIDAFTLGVRALKFSADEALGGLAGDDKERRADSSGREIGPWMMALNVGMALVLFVLFFKLLPLVLASALQQRFGGWLGSHWLFGLVDGVIRLSIFLAYLVLVSKIRDIRRVFEYHGAEHKVVFTYESREHLSVENARKYPTLHPRCGTSFLMVVMLISALVYAFIPFESFSLRFFTRIALIPLIAGFSYEVIRLSARTRSSILGVVTRPGLWLQRVTTREPSDDQLEVAIRALNEALTMEKVEGQLAVV